MNAKFEAYLKSVGMTSALISRVDEILGFYRGLLSEPIDEVYVSEYLDDEGTRTYENLWVFNSNFVGEAKQFVGKDIFDLTPLDFPITRWEITKKHYDFHVATPKSRLTVYVSFDNGVHLSFKASQQNCDNARDILLTYIHPRMDPNGMGKK